MLNAHTIVMWSYSVLQIMSTSILLLLSRITIDPINYLDKGIDPGFFFSLSSTLRFLLISKEIMHWWKKNQAYLSGEYLIVSTTMLEVCILLCAILAVMLNNSYVLLVVLKYVNDHKIWSFFTLSGSRKKQVLVLLRICQNWPNSSTDYTLCKN